ncbi:MAG: M14 family zinc carboxypeptidase, partial [Acidobacteriota bacterium]
RPLISTDQRRWTYLPESSVEWLPAEPALRLTIVAAAPHVWIAHQVPYTSAHVSALAKDAAKERSFRTETIGSSVEGRPLYLWTIHDAAGAAQGAKPVVWLMFRQHAWESGSSFAGEGLVRWLLGPGGDAQAARQKFVWKILPTADPDGLAHGGARFNRNGYDLNRNWDHVLAEKMPEIAAQQRAIYSWIDAGNKVDLFLTVHNTETSEYLDGPPLPLGERWFGLLKGGTTFHPSRPYSVMAGSTTEGKPGRMNVSQGLWHERKIPAFGMEQRVQFNEKLGHYPSVEDRLRFGAELAQSIVKLFE